jgi:phospholipid-binding lipoprotein MlaA
MLVVTAAGCASSDTTGDSDLLGVDPGDQQVLIDVNDAAEAMETEQVMEDDDFDLFEDELDNQAVQVADPLQPVNRLIFNFNDVIYIYVLEPCAKGYRAVVPKPGRIGVRNFFSNLMTPARLVNCLLQGKNESAWTELKRFGINTTEGILGVGDPALDKYGVEITSEDLGQTLAVYGLGNGCYLVLPLLGPSSARDTAGMVGDWFLNPVRYVEPTEASIAITAGKFTNERSFRVGEYQAFKDEAVDPYIAMREAYIQYRNKQIAE